MPIFVIEIVVDFSEHYKRSISLHYKINTIGDPSLTIINVHYKRSISYNEKRFSLITLKLLRIPQKSLLQILPPNISSELYLTVTDHILSATRLCCLSTKYISLPRLLAAGNLSSGNGTLDPCRQVRNFKYCMRTQNVKIEFWLTYLLCR